MESFTKMAQTEDNILSIEILNEFKNFSFKNFKSLLDDANLLYDNKRFARSTFLYISAIEEYGKYLLLCSYTMRAMCGFETDLNSLKKAIYSHEYKLTHQEYDRVFYQTYHDKKSIDSKIKGHLKKFGGRFLN